MSRADKQFRSNPEDIGQLYVRSQQDQMIPLSNLVKLASASGAQTINHTSVPGRIEISGSAAQGSSSGQNNRGDGRIAQQVLPQKYGLRMVRGIFRGANVLAVESADNFSVWDLSSSSWFWQLPSTRTTLTH